MLKRIKRIIIPFVVISLPYFIVLMLTDNYLVTEKSFVWYVEQFFTLTLAPWSTWFLKIQFIIYFVDFGIYCVCKKINKPNLAIYIIGIILLVYTLTLAVMGVQYKWWTSACCYCVGQFIAQYKNQLLKKRIFNPWTVTALFLCTIFLYGITTFKIGYCTIITNIVGSIAVIGLTNVIAFESNVLRTIGKMSLEFYLVQLCMMQLVMNTMPYDDNIKVGIYVACVFIFGILTYCASVRIEKKIVFKQ